MPKVLRIINRFNLGGPTYNAALLTRFLTPEYETLLVGGSIDDSEGSSMHILEELGIEGQVIPHMKRSIHPANDYKAQKEIEQIIQDFRPDIVHTHASKAGALGRRAAYKMKVPVIVHTFHGHVFHSYFTPWKSKLYQKIERKLASKSSCIIAISELQKEELANKYHICPAEKVEVIPLGFDLSKFTEDMDSKRTAFRKKYQLEDDTVAIGIIGRLVPIKNHELFIRGIAGVLSSGSRNIKAFVVGDGELRAKLEQSVQDQGLSDHFVFTSWEKEVDKVLAGLDVVALTSNNEGTPVSIIEAKAAGKAVVSSRVGGVADIIKDNKSGLLFEPGDNDMLVNHLKKLITDKEFRQQIGEEGRESTLKKYHYERLVKDMRSLYERLLSM